MPKVYNIYKMNKIYSNISELRISLSENEDIDLYEVLDELLKSGLDLGSASFENRYKSIFDKMFKTSIRFARVEEIEYLMGILNANWIDASGIIRWLANEEDIAGIIDEKLTERGCKTLLNFLMDNGVSMEDIISILN